MAVTYNHSWKLRMDLIRVCFVWHVETASRAEKRTMAYKKMFQRDYISDMKDKIIYDKR